MLTMHAIATVYKRQFTLQRVKVEIDQTCHLQGRNLNRTHPPVGRTLHLLPLRSATHLTLFTSYSQAPPPLCQRHRETLLFLRLRGRFPQRSLPVCRTLPVEQANVSSALDPSLPTGADPNTETGHVIRGTGVII